VDAPTTVVRTVGHASRPLEEFLHLLRAYRVTLVVDVRKMPGSRPNPQFNRDALSNALHEAHIGYVHLPGLGGLRRRMPSSPNTGWKIGSFQGYADYMLTPEFERSLATERYSRDSRERENTPLQGTFSASQRKPGPRCAFEHSPKTARWTDARASTAHRLLTVIFDTAPDAMLLPRPY